MTPPAAPVICAVLDTNVVLDLLLFKDARAQPLHQALARSQLCWIATAPMLAELDRVLRRPALAPWGHDADRVMAAAQGHCRAVSVDAEARHRAPRCTDPDDQIFIDLAWHWPAALLFSRDRAVLRLARQARAHRLWIGRPEQWAALPPTRP